MDWMTKTRVLKGVEERNSFVKHNGGDSIPEVGEFFQGSSSFEEGGVTVVIPTIDAHRGGYFPVLLEDIKRQSLESFQLLVVKGDKRQGRAINLGVALSKGDIIIILDDDVRLGHSDVFTNLVAALKSDSKIGMAGVSNLVPEEAPWLVRRVMAEVPRRSSPIVNEITESDMAEHPCCAIPKKVFKETGGENEQIPRGLDPYLRAELRKRGYKVVVIPDSWIHHLPPKRLLPLIRQFFRNGKYSAYCTRFYPHWTIELAEEHSETFKERVSIGYRSFRYIKKLMKAFFTLKWIYLLTLLCYLTGFGWGYMALKKEEV
jgi:cellulose synthase/poly-beta-1,6-N-acetylglucosamine synthase-like glycosyltransferase